MFRLIPVSLEEAQMVLVRQGYASCSSEDYNRLCENQKRPRKKRGENMQNQIREEI